MKRKLFVALSAVAFNVVLAIAILGHCGNTWVVQEPSFGPQLTRSNCTTGGGRTTTSKSVETTIHWTVGAPLTVVITDSGENHIVSGTFTDGCTRCFPVFGAPEWIELGDVTEWSQKTFRQTVGNNQDCVTDLTRGAIDHHFGRNCTVGEEECETQLSWYWDPINDVCQSDPPPPCNVIAPEFCPQGPWDPVWCGCVTQTTPILLDIAGDGFNLTNAADGVSFNLNNMGGREKLAWTTAGSDDVWLALDRNGNGKIDDGTELFGDITPQPDPPAGEKKNGFRALAEYDKLANGGNANNQIDSADSIFPSLRLWRDVNHNGLSEPSELNTMSSKNVAALELDYKYSKKTDNHGNQFSFRAKVMSSDRQQLGRWAWDVYLLKSSQ